jgi:hypothetical protein
MWPTMGRLYPQECGPEAAEGTAAHWVFAQMLDGQPVNVGTAAPNGVIVTDEMLDGADLVLQTIGSTLPPGVDLHVEESVPIAKIHPECWGTPDIWAYIASSRTIRLYDYKFGHNFVDEFENEQGVAYVTGIIDKLRPEIGPADVNVEFMIIQPRCFYRGAPVRTWSFNYESISHLVAELIVAARAALAPDPTATTNPECDYCPGRHACDALQRAAYHDAEFATKSTPMELPPAAASLELRMLERAYERLGARIDGLKETVAAHIKRGERAPYHQVTQGYGRPQWSVPVEQVIAMGELMGVDLSKPGVVTPKQAIKNGIDETVINAYSTTPMGALKLIPVNPDDVRRVFSINY